MTEEPLQLAQDKLDEAAKRIQEATVATQEELEAYRLEYLSRNGLIAKFFEAFRSVPGEQKRLFGKPLNELKQLAEAKFEEAKRALEAQAQQDKALEMDLTLPPVPHALGGRHPLSLTRARIVEIFERMGFNLAEGPEIEQDWYNFTALNFPPNHPAREMQDTFFVEKNPDVVLRTHTSSVQIRAMENQDPPIRTLSLGRVYRNEAVSAKKNTMFHQIEGLYVNQNVSFADLKQTLYHFVREYFGPDTKVRFRPSYFPFTEPSAEMDIEWVKDGKAEWLEILGCGMVDPNVLQNCGIDPETYTGFAFGIGVERLTMLQYRIDDLRLFFENDVRFLRQFKPFS